MKFSIIIPHFNRPNLVTKCIKSFDKLNDKEIIVIDDVSLEENIKILKTNIKNFQNVVLYESKEKLTLGGARNKGLEFAKGKWVFFIDDDDCATEKFIQFLNTAILDENVSFYRFPYIHVNKNDKTIWKVKNMFIKSNEYSVQVSTFLFNKSFLIQNNLHFVSNILSEDVIFSMDIYNKKYKQKYIKNVFSIKYLSDNLSITRRKKWPNLNEHKKTIKYIQNTNYRNKNKYLLYILVTLHSLIRKNKFVDNEQAKIQFRNIKKSLNLKVRDYFQLNWFIFFKSISLWF